MYSGTLSRRDRAGPVAGVVLVHLALAAMLLGLSGHLTPAAVEHTLTLIDVREIPPPPPLPEIRPGRPAKAAAAAPPAKKAEATQIVAPKPQVVIPAPTPIVAAPVSGQGAASSQGAALAGAGTGAGGSGNGTGGGGGSGDGDGGDDGTHPRPLFHPVDPRTYPRQLVEPLARGTRVLVIFTVQLDGRVTDCSVRQPSGDAALDALVCQIAQQRFRYDPARHGDGTPYIAKAAYLQVF